jgi:hypothetical protein
MAPTTMRAGYSESSNTRLRHCAYFRTGTEFLPILVR